MSTKAVQAPNKLVSAENVTAMDRLIKSIRDNEHRMALSQLERLRAAKTLQVVSVAKQLNVAGVPVDRAAHALGVSARKYKRYLRIARNG